MYTITDKIDALLQQRGMSRRQLAIAAKISPSTFQSAMQRGKNITIEMLQAVATVLCVPISSFFEFEIDLAGQEDVKTDIDQMMLDFVDELRGQAREFECSLGSLLDVSAEHQAAIDDKEDYVEERRHAMDWGEHDPYGTADEDERRKELYEAAEAEQAKLVLHAILDAAKTKIQNNDVKQPEAKKSSRFDSQTKVNINNLLSLYLQFNGKGQREILEWVQDLAQMMVQIPAYRHQPDLDDLRDVFGGRVSFDDGDN